MEQTIQAPGKGISLQDLEDELQRIKHLLESTRERRKTLLYLIKLQKRKTPEAAQRMSGVRKPRKKGPTLSYRRLPPGWTRLPGSKL